MFIVLAFFLSPFTLLLVAHLFLIKILPTFDNLYSSSSQETTSKQIISEPIEWENSNNTLTCMESKRSLFCQNMTSVGNAGHSVQYLYPTDEF